jgi:hypothetical protein
MGCPHSGGGSNRDRKGVERRQFLLSAVAIGGTSALAACIDREETQPSQGTTSQSAPNGTTKGNSTETVSPAEETEPLDEDSSEDPPDPPDEPPIYRNLDRADAQHAWNNYVRTNEHGVPHPPRHHVLVLADYADTGTPTEDERTRMERSLKQLEAAYEWSNDGLVFTVGYSPAYFDRFDADLPPEVDLPEPIVVSEFDDPVLESYDVSIHLASDHAQAVLGAEEALFGSLDEIQGVTIETDLRGVLEKRDRRTGFIGEGLPAQNQNVEGIPDSEPVPEESPLYMGFQTNHGAKEQHPFHGETDATFVHNQNSEYGVMIKEGRFKYGTTQHVSRLRLELGDWYGDHSLDERVNKMFGGQFNADLVGETGEGARESRVFTEQRDLDTTGGLVGHAEKMALAREQGVPQLLRRDFDTADNDRAGVHFVSLQEEIADFVQTRSIMNGTRFRDVDGIDKQQNNGILEFVTAESRANFLVPPQELRSLPRPQ